MCASDCSYFICYISSLYSTVMSIICVRFPFFHLHESVFINVHCFRSETHLRLPQGTQIIFEISFVLRISKLLNRKSKVYGRPLTQPLTGLIHFVLWMQNSHIILFVIRLNWFVFECIWSRVGSAKGFIVFYYCLIFLIHVKCCWSKYIVLGFSETN